MRAVYVGVCCVCCVVAEFLLCGWFVGRVWGVCVGGVWVGGV